MTAAPTDSGLALLCEHLASLDPATPTARERLEEALGPELARKLVFALCTGSRAGERGGPASGARAVFAA